MLPSVVMSLAQLSYFVAVAEEGTIGRAAARLHVSQPPISRQLRSLEDELGARLFDRTRAGVTLRPEGRVFLDYARQVLDTLDRASAAVRASHDDTTPDT